MEYNNKELTELRKKLQIAYLNTKKEYCNNKNFIYFISSENMLQMTKLWKFSGIDCSLVTFSHLILRDKIKKN